jgi:hypothetical protein
MLNLLIAIISVAHAKVVEEEEMYNYAELNSIVLELEVFMIWNRSKNDRQHLIFAEYETGENVLRVKELSLSFDQRAEKDEKAMKLTEDLKGLKNEVMGEMNKKFKELDYKLEQFDARVSEAISTNAGH